MGASATLPLLLWTVLRGLEQAYVAEGAGSGHMPSLDQWANLLRALDESGIDRRDLPAILRLSKRAVRSRLLSAARKGWIEEVRIGRGQARVRLTTRGSEILAHWKSLRDAAEGRWQESIGVERTTRLRRALEEIVSVLPLELSHYPASYGAADATVTGGNGQDWRAIPREGGRTVSLLPLSALVSEALVAFAMNYEEKSPVALSLSTTIIKRIPSQGRLLRELGNSVVASALERHGFIRVDGASGGEIVTLTRKGHAVSEAYAQRVQAVEAVWRDRFGNETVTCLRRALEGVTNIQAR
jgi:hypothetical protein